MRSHLRLGTLPAVITCKGSTLKLPTNIQYLIHHIMSFGLRSLRIIPKMGGPLYLFGPPLLLLVSIPLTVFAVLTTTVAFSLLAARVSIVYFELGVALLHAYFSPMPAKPVSKLPSPNPQSPKHPRNRQSSICSTASSAETALPAAYPPQLANKSGSFVSLIGSNDATRDYEGVGGWRVSGDDEEEALWMGMNSRLELPARAPKRHHRRSNTAGSQQFRGSWSPETTRMSPMQSRTRTPVQTAGDERPHSEGYFSPQASYSIRPLSIASEPAGKSTQDCSRASPSRSSSSSTGASSRMMMMAKPVET